MQCMCEKYLVGLGVICLLFAMVLNALPGKADKLYTDPEQVKPELEQFWQKQADREAADEEEPMMTALPASEYVREDIPLSFALQDVLHTACEQYGISYYIGLGLIETESNFRMDAVSASGCYGLMQLNPRYFPSDLCSVENIQTGIAYLAEQLERYGGDMRAALCAYHAGYDTGSRSYANKVLEAAERWENR